MQATLPRTAIPAESAKTPKPVVRNLAVDTYRGFVMLLMMAEVVQLARVFRNFPTSRFWSFLAYHQTHVAWAGCSLHDTIQPGFRSWSGWRCPTRSPAASRRAAPSARCFCTLCGGRCCWSRSGSSCAPCAGRITYFTFEDTLSQIGLGYPLLFLLGVPAAEAAMDGARCILIGYWLAWALYPRPDLGGALGQGDERRRRVRPLVPESLPAHAAVCEQQRRLSDPELHPDARHDDAGPVRRAVAARRRAADSRSANS